MPNELSLIIGNETFQTEKDLITHNPSYIALMLRFTDGATNENLNILISKCGMKYHDVVPGDTPEETIVHGYFLKDITHGKIKQAIPALCRYDVCVPTSISASA